LALLTLLQNYPVDDAFISFRYARNLVEGQGLVWNPGERVEGYSNFLWALLLAGGMLIGLEPLTTASVLSLASYLVLLWLTYRIGQRVIGSRVGALMATGLTGLSHSITAFARSGLETVFVAMLFLAAIEALERNVVGRWSVQRMVVPGIMLTLAVLTRLDAGLLMIWAIVVFVQARQSDRHYGFDLRQLGALLVIPAIVLLPYALWKLNYYGSLLPNPARVKVHGLTGLGFGLYYLYLFGLSHLLIPYWAILAGLGRRLMRENATAGRLLSLTILWFVYAAAVGGDFMEFRFLAPVIPLMVVLITASIVRYIPLRPVGSLLLVGLALGMFNGWFSLSRFVFSYGLETASELRDHLIHPKENWTGIGLRLGELFGGTNVKLSAGAAGAIPYYSGLVTVDFIGLTDPHLPRIGLPFTKVPGHRIIAPVEYLMERGVNLLVEPNNFMFTNGDFATFARSANWGSLQRFYLNLERPVKGRALEEVILLGIPIDGQHTLAAWYMTPHPEVERIAREQGFRRIRISRW